MIKKLFLSLSVLALGLTSLQAKEADWPKELNFGVIPTAGSTSVRDMFTGLTEYLEKKLDVKINLQLASDYTGVITAMQHKHIDFGYFGPKSYIEAAKRSNAQALVSFINAESGLAGYNGIIITRKDSGLNTLEDLKGKKWAFTASQSTSGTLVPTVMFEKRGIDPKKYFSQVMYSGGHEASILSLKAGKIDAISTSNLDLNRGDGIHWKKDDFNIIWTSDLIPSSPIAIRGDLPESLKIAMRNALLEYKDPKGLERLKIKGFSPANDSLYDSIRELSVLQQQLKNK